MKSPNQSDAEPMIRQNDLRSLGQEEVSNIVIPIPPFLPFFGEICLESAIVVWGKKEGFDDVAE